MGGAQTLQLQELSVGMRSRVPGERGTRAQAPIPTDLPSVLAVSSLSENHDPDGLWVLIPTRSLETPTQHIPLCDQRVMGGGRVCP